MQNYFKWHGHSTVEVCLQDTTILFDPFLKQDVEPHGYKRVTPTTSTLRDFDNVNYILISHEHFDHLDTDNLVAIARRNNATVYLPSNCVDEVNGLLPASLIREVGAGQKFAAANLQVEAVEASHHESANPLGYLVSGGQGKEEVRVYFAGDTRFFGEMRRIKADIAFLPIGGKFTMDVLGAVQAAREIKPQFVVPIHYDTFPEITVDVGDFEAKVHASNLGIQALVPGIGEKIEF